MAASHVRWPWGRREIDDFLDAELRDEMAQRRLAPSIPYEATFVDSAMESRSCGKVDLAGKLCPFTGTVRIYDIEGGSTWWCCPRCDRAHTGASL